MNLPRMSLHIGDYRKDTGHLRAAGHGAYLLLMMHYWQSGGLPDDDERLARITGFLRIEDWQAVRPVVQAFFHDGWKHKRIDAEFGKSTERSKAGRMGGRPKAKEKQNESKPESKSEAPQPLPQKEVGGGGSAGARDPERSMIGDEAKRLTEEIAVIAGYPEVADWPPGWCGAPLRVQAFLDAGWHREVMLAAAREAMGNKRDGPPFSIGFFERPFARAHARHGAPVPVAVVVSNEPEKVYAARKSPAGNVIEAADRILERMRDLGEAAVRGRAGPPDARLLSKG